jgi:hypothetical protein
MLPLATSRYAIDSDPEHLPGLDALQEAVELLSRQITACRQRGSPEPSPQLQESLNAVLVWINLVQKWSEKPVCLPGSPTWDQPVAAWTRQRTELRQQLCARQAAEWTERLQAELLQELGTREAPFSLEQIDTLDTRTCQRTMHAVADWLPQQGDQTTLRGYYALQVVAAVNARIRARRDKILYDAWLTKQAPYLRGFQDPEWTHAALLARFQQPGTQGTSIEAMVYQWLEPLLTAWPEDQQEPVREWMDALWNALTPAERAEAEQRAAQDAAA